MDFKEDGVITVDKIKKKKVKCHKFHYKPLNRYLMVHADMDNQDQVSVSDFSTGYRLFKIQVKPDKVTSEQLIDKLEKYTNHFTIEGIQEEIQRLENKELELVQSQRKK